MPSGSPSFSMQAERFSEYLRARPEDTKKVLLYFSSGPLDRDWETLPFDLAIMVDKGHGDIHLGSKVICLSMDNHSAARLLAFEGIKATALVAINDGCREGGNYECLYESTAFGSLIPVLDEGCTVVTDHAKPRSWSPFESKTCPIPDWGRSIVPTYCQPDEVHSFQLTLRPLPPVEFREGETVFRILHDSVWNHLGKLDVLILPKTLCDSRGLWCYLSPAGPNPDWYNKQNWSKERPMLLFSDPWPTASILSLLREAVSHGHRRIGVLPSFGRNGRTVVEEAIHAGVEGLSELIFFHLEKKDFHWAR